MADCVYAFIRNRQKLMDNTHEMNNLCQRTKTSCGAQDIGKEREKKVEWSEAKTIPSNDRRILSRIYSVYSHLFAATISFSLRYIADQILR